MAVKFDFKTLGEPLVVDWPVAVSVPQDGGKVQETEFVARFKLLSEEETTELQSRATSAKDDPYAWINGFWVGLGAAEGEELTSELRKAMLARPYVRMAIVRAYTNCTLGQAAAKN